MGNCGGTAGGGEDLSDVLAKMGDAQDETARAQDEVARLQAEDKKSKAAIKELKKKVDKLGDSKGARGPCPPTTCATRMPRAARSTHANERARLGRASHV